ncbi:MAG TPA: EAL domain-containing protein [Gaiellales bacterium]|jgi:diguanylate cyclase (GGDEF)-like protein/PAS domain S-box-containing protein
MGPDGTGGRHAGWDDERIHALVSSMPGAVYRYVHREGRWHMESVSNAIEAITGYPTETFLPGGERPYDSIIHPDDRDAVAAAARQAMTQCEPFAIEYRIMHADGSVRWVNGHGTGIAADDGSLLYADGVIFDVTERKQTEARLTHLALHDALTDLPNRALFQEHLNLAIAHAHRTGIGGAVLFVDLDDFKMINDGFGHAVGDALLVQVARRLRESCRADDVVARQGGDEFLILLSGSGDTAGSEEAAADAAQKVAASMRTALGLPFHVGDTELYVTASIGASLYPSDADTAEAVLKHADVALYAAKDAGRDGYRLYSEPKHDTTRELALAARLRNAEKRDELILLYQPMVDLQTSCIVGAEALIRWKTPDGELVPPADFLPVAERTGLIRPITAWVVEQACIQARRWCDLDLDLYASINVPPSYWQAASMRRVLATIADFGLPADRIMIEITEQSAMNQSEELAPLVEEFRRRGLRLAIDDFGTGHSSLGRLRQLRPNTLKIDRSFIRDLPNDKEAAILVEIMITLAQRLGMHCLAEGIETEAQLRFLVEHGCHLGQGFLYSRPLPVSGFTALITGIEERAA